MDDVPGNRTGNYVMGPTKYYKYSEFLASIIKPLPKIPKPDEDSVPDTYNTRTPLTAGQLYRLRVKPMSHSNEVYIPSTLGNFNLNLVFYFQTAVGGYSDQRISVANFNRNNITCQFLNGDHPHILLPGGNYYEVKSMTRLHIKVIFLARKVGINNHIMYYQFNNETLRKFALNMTIKVLPFALSISPQQIKFPSNLLEPGDPFGVACQSIYLRNSLNLPKSFSWNIGDGFHILPKSGVVGPVQTIICQLHQSCQTTVPETEACLISEDQPYQIVKVINKSSEWKFDVRLLAKELDLGNFLFRSTCGRHLLLIKLLFSRFRSCPVKLNACRIITII